MSYKDKTWCPFRDCVNYFPSKCNRVLTDYDLKNLREGKYSLSLFREKPDCYENKSK